MEPGNLYEVSTRHDSSAGAIRDAMIIPIKLHGKGVPSAGEYVEVSKLTRDVIMGEPAGNNMYALIGLLAAAPSKQTVGKDGRTFDLITMLVHVLDQAGELHLSKIKMWGSPPAEARKGVALRAIYLTKSEFKGDVSFEASKLTVIAWGYKDPKNRADARHVAELKDAVAREESDNVEVREVEVVLRPGAPRFSSSAPAASAAAASSGSSSSASSSKAQKARVVVLDDEDEEDEQ